MKAIDVYGKFYIIYKMFFEFLRNIPNSIDLDSATKGKTRPIICEQFLNLSSINIITVHAYALYIIAKEALKCFIWVAFVFFALLLFCISYFPIIVLSLSPSLILHYVHINILIFIIVFLVSLYIIEILCVYIETWNDKTEWLIGIPYIIFTSIAIHVLNFGTYLLGGQEPIMEIISFLIIIGLYILSFICFLLFVIYMITVLSAIFYVIESIIIHNIRTKDELEKYFSERRISNYDWNNN